MAKEIVAMILAGGRGSRLYALTQKTAKPAVSFGGKYRIVDFPLSNCVNSGIDTVGVLTQYEPHELNVYLANGQTWDLDRLNGGVSVLSPYENGSGSEWYKGTANAIYQNIGFIDEYDPEYVLILSGDHIYKMDYDKMLDQHKEKNAAATIAVLNVTLEEAKRFGIMNCNPDGSIYEFEEKPAHPKSTLASMGIYIFTWSKLRKYLIDDENDPNSSNDFGKNIIPAMLANGENLQTYQFDGYWKDVGTIESLWEANMEVLDPEHSGINLFDENWKIYSRNSGMTGHRIGENAVLDNCLITDGCNIKGTVRHSILFSGVTVEEGAIVEDAVVMGHSTIKAGAVVRHCIIAENATIEEDAVVGAKPKGEGVGEVATIAADVTIGKGAKIGPSAMIYEDVKEGEEQC